jgi:hypothetical protein
MAIDFEILRIMGYLRADSAMDGRDGEGWTGGQSCGLVWPSDRSLQENLVVERAVQLDVLAGNADVRKAKAPIEAQGLVVVRENADERLSVAAQAREGE